MRYPIRRNCYGDWWAGLHQVQTGFREELRTNLRVLGPVSKQRGQPHTVANQWGIERDAKFHVYSVTWRNGQSYVDQHLQFDNWKAAKAYLLLALAAEGN